MLDTRDKMIKGLKFFQLIAEYAGDEEIYLAVEINVAEESFNWIVEVGDRVENFGDDFEGAVDYYIENGGTYDE